MQGCSVEGCAGAHKGLGLCSRHYQEFKRREAGIGYRKVRGVCSVEWCTRPAHAHGLCSNHYQILKRNGHPEAYKRARNGEGTVGPGPRMISTERGQEYEHIVVCRCEYGELPAGFVIHHLDGNNKNNVLDNLVVCVNQAQHMRIHWRQSLLALGIDDVNRLGVETPIHGHTTAVKEVNGRLYDACDTLIAMPPLPDSYGLLNYWNNK